MLQTDQTETERLNAMKRYLELSLNHDNKLHDIVMLASTITETPVAFISLMDKEVQWITAKFGYDVSAMPRATSFCTHTIDIDGLMIVPDATADPRFKENPIVKSPGARFYAGAPLKSFDGYNIGTICVMDVKPNNLNQSQQECLQALSRQASSLMDLNLNVSLLKESVTQIENKNATLKKLAQVQSHEFRGPLSTVMTMMNLIKDEGYPSNKEYLLMLESAVNQLDEKICSSVNMASLHNQLFIHS